jgi:hypothetical protein
MQITGEKPPTSVSSQLEEMWHKLRPGLAGLFTESSVSYSSFEKGWYIRGVMKPTKRMAAALATDRELLFLATNFSDQQPRVIEFAKKVIAQEKGRLEHLVVIIHLDQDGDRKLKTWGREQALTVLPILLDVTADATPESVQRSLSSELFSRDPFDVSTPVSDDSHFFGRRDEAIDLARTIATSRIRSYFGVRKIGKTSLIYRVVDLIKNSNDADVVYIDCQRDAIFNMNAAQMIASIATSIEQLSLTGAGRATPRHNTFSGTIGEAGDALQDLLQKISRPLLIAIDELDYITPSSPTAPLWAGEFVPFWRCLRSVHQEITQRRLPVSLIVSGVSSKWFAQESIGGVENAALHFVPEQYLAPFPRPVSTQMIKRLASRCGLSFSEHVLERIAADCADFPFWIRRACSFMHQSIDLSKRPTDVSDGDAVDLLDRFVRTEGQALSQLAIEHLCRVYPEIRPSLLACLDGMGQSQEKWALASLSRYGIVDASQNWAIRGSMTRNGVLAYLDKSSSETPVRPAVDALSAGGDARSEQWADDLAIVNRTRNIVERQMRDLIVVVLRVSAVGESGDKLSARDLVLRAIPENRRSDLGGIPLNELMSKLFWLDLYAIVNKYWSSFEKVFGDKILFQQNCFVVNDRPDAHAKRIDAADLALHRRSLKWLQDRLNDSR